MNKLLKPILIGTALLGSLNLTAQTNRRNLKKSVVYRANYQRIASNANSHFSFEIREGTLWAWGWNAYGQLGDGTNIDRNSPVQIGKDSNWVSIATGNVHCVGLKSDGTVWAWGYNGDGRLGDGTTNSYKTPVQIGKDDKWISISCGYAHTLGIKSDGTLWAWGYNDHGQLGTGTTATQKVQVQIGNDSRWTSISCGGNTSRALKSDGTLWAWGANNKGQFGNGTALDSYSPIQIGNDNKWVTTITGWTHSLGIKSDGTLWACGLNDHGQLGDGTTVDRISPVQVGKSTKWVSISVGQWHSLGLMSDGTLWAWGQGISGELGDSTTTDRHEPVKIGKDRTWVSIVAGRDHSLGIKADGSLWAWGDNANGQLGDGSNTYYIAPYKIRTENKWLTLSGGKLFSAAVKSNGTIWAWGYNGYGQLGDSSNNQKSEPVQIGKENTWASISAGGNHALGLKADGTLWAWGKNSNGQLGDSTITNRIIPVQVGTDDRWTSISSGTNFSVGLKSDGTLWAWGDNSLGQLGDGTNTQRNSPVKIGSDNKWVSISAGSSHVLALRCDGTLWAWGYNANGQLGDGTTIQRNNPVQIGTDNKWVNIATGNYHSLGLKSNGLLLAWGYNNMGQLGQGSNVQTNSPARIGSDTKWIGMAAGGFHTLGYKSDGTLWTWGDNDAEQLGDTTTKSRAIPVQIGKETNWVGISGGGYHSLGLKSDRKQFWAVGNNCYGQLGDSSISNCDSPKAPSSDGAFICSGSKVALSAYGVGQIGWYSAANGGNYLGGGENFVTPVLTRTTTYYVQDSVFAPSATRTAVVVTVFPLPKVSIHASDTVVCLGTEISFKGRGAIIYMWSGGVKDSMSFIPLATQTYTVVGLDSNNCSDSAVIAIRVDSLPNVNIIATDTIVCQGTLVTLKGTGAETYKWSGGVTDGIGFISTSTVSYTVIGSDGNNCSDTSDITIRVNALPIVTAIATDSVVCKGQSVKLKGEGALFYSWTGGISNDLSFVPVKTSSYTLTGLDGNKCSNSDTITITVNPLPIVTATASDTLVCAGTRVTLNGGGALTYIWSRSVTNGVAFTPTATASYRVTGTDENDCSDTASIFVVVRPLPDVTTTKNGFSLTANQAGGTYLWLDCNNGKKPIANATGQTYTAPKAGDYAVLVTLNNGCSDTSACVNTTTGGFHLINKDARFHVYPNPNAGDFVITSTEAGYFYIINEFGQPIDHFQLSNENDNMVNIKNLSNGVYLIVGFNSDLLTRQKIVVLR